MNEQLQQALATILNKATSGVEAGLTFLQAELPDVVRQLLMWKLVESLVVVALSLLFVAGYAWFVRIYVKSKPGGALKDHNGPSMGAFMVLAFGAALIFVDMFAGLLPSLFTAIQILVAPKLYLIEYAAKSMK